MKSIQWAFLLFLVLVHNQALAQYYYDIGQPSVRDVFVDPVNGNDANSGQSRSQALRTLTAAWDQIPQGQVLTTGVRVQILPGILPEAALPNYLESRFGTFQAPIIFQAADGYGTVVLGGDLNIYNTRYLYLINLRIVPVPAGDAVHCEKCDHLLVRGCELDGGNRVAQETFKANQSSYIFVESSNVHGAFDNALDFVGVQHGHFVANKVHNAEDWCGYVKGGSAYVRVEGNEFYDCGTGGFSAGQGSGFEYMVSPWLHYEAYDVRVINNVVHDTEGAGLGVNGGFNILIAHNTLYRVGTRSHGLEVVFGARSCDGNTSRCQDHLNQGGWGTLVHEPGLDIPSRNVYVMNNVLHNPTGVQSPYQHLAIYGPRASQPGSNLPGSVTTDTNLVIRGNIFWNGPAGLALGIEGDDQGCRPGNATCNETQLRSENTFNGLQPQFVNAAEGDFRPLPGGNLASATGAALPNFPGDDRPATPLSPAGPLENEVTSDRSGTTRASVVPGAYLPESSSLVPEPPPGATLPGDSSPGAPTLTIRNIRVQSKRVNSKKRTVSISCTIAGGTPSQVSGSLVSKKNRRTTNVRMRAGVNGRYSGKASVAAGKYTLRLSAANSAGAVTQKSKSLTAG